MKPRKTRRAKVTARRTAGQDHAVLTLEGGRGDLYRREPCAQCPWREDATGVFPAEAFVHSANTADDASFNTFACHESGACKPATCAGFLLKNADNNIAVRIKVSQGAINMDEVRDGGHKLHASYKAMAVANGVAPDHPALARCRENGAPC